VHTEWPDSYCIVLDQRIKGHVVYPFAVPELRVWRFEYSDAIRNAYCGAGKYMDEMSADI
ncbi:hypothetical protein P0E39_14170, partial [Enterococcus faecalis]|nr:hypothetical protein [Enterococcus faecalis]